MAEIAALIGDPGRSNMLGALLSGRALTATELAAAAGVSRSTASEHLAKLTESRLISLSRQGRHRYYSLASAHVARMLETIMAVSADRDEEPPRSARRIDPALREARTCYDHLAGRLGVSLAGALITKGAIVLTEEAGEVTGHGRRFAPRLWHRPGSGPSNETPPMPAVFGLERAQAAPWRPPWRGPSGAHV